MKKLKTILEFKPFYFILIISVILYILIYTLVLKTKSKLNINKENFLCIINNHEIDGDKLSLKLNCDENLIGIYYLKTEREKISYQELEIGDKVNIKGKLTVPKNNTIPNLFNYKDYLKKQDIHYILNIEKITLENKNKNILYKIKNLAYKRASTIKDNEYIYTYILGYTKKIDDETLENYRKNGIGHLFALSGLHISIFSIMLLKLFKKLKVNLLISYILVSTFLLLFAFITGFSPSILRATIFFILLTFNKYYKLNISSINILYITFTILVIMNPFIIYNVSFILSFTTTFFIIKFTNTIKEKNYVKSLLKVSLVSFFSTLGLSIYFFGLINPLGILLNLIFVPLVSYIIFPLSIIVYIIPSLTTILLLSTKFMEILSNFFSNFKTIIYFPHINLLDVLIYYVILIIFIKTKKKPLVILILILISIWYIKPKLNNNTEIYFLDVGQGDSILIVGPNKTSSILIDSGGKLSYKKEKWKERSKTYSIAEDSLIPFFRSLGINKLDYLITTHGDYDHMGEAYKLIENFKVEKVIFNKGDYNDLENNLISLLNKRKIKYYKDLDELKINKTKYNFLSKNYYNNENDNSNVIYFKINNFKILLMGDASKKVEEDIINNFNLNNIDILKVGHHGSKTSSSKLFIDKMSPKYSIISVGANNKYNHPNEETIDNLKNTKIYRTDLNGSILFKIKNNTIKIKTYAP